MIRGRIKKIIIIVPYNGYSEEEVSSLLEVFKNKFDIKIASSALGYAKGEKGGSLKIDLLIDEVSSKDADAFVFVNGPGFQEFSYNFMIANLIKEVYESGKILGAISSAPFIFALCGILAHKKATGSEDIAWIIKDGGGYFTGLDIERDGNVFTAISAIYAKKLAKEIVLALH